MVILTLQAPRREKGRVQRQGLPLRFRGSVKDLLVDLPLASNMRAAPAILGNSLTNLRDRALHLVAYGTGLCASEQLAVKVEDLVEAKDADACPLQIRRSKVDQEGEGPTAHLSSRSVTAVSL